MKKAIKDKWLKALRSGDYKQAKSVLKDDDGCMCCLGVLCDITQKETGGKWTKQDFIAGGEGHDETIPTEACNILGITHKGKLKKSYQTKHGDLADHLTILNDSGLSFKQIANIIEKNF